MDCLARLKKAIFGSAEPAPQPLKSHYIPDGVGAISMEPQIFLVDPPSQPVLGRGSLVARQYTETGMGMSIYADDPGAPELVAALKKDNAPIHRTVLDMLTTG